MAENTKISVPPDLLEQWRTAPEYTTGSLGRVEMVSMRLQRLQEIADQAAQYGADQRLKACVEWLTSNNNPMWALALQEAMRPTPPSLAKEALEALEKEDDALVHSGFKKSDRFALIRRALEHLQELENND